MPRLACLTVLVLLLSACGPSGPSNADIHGAYEQELPGLLKLESLELENLRNSGSEEQPVWTARTIATLALREPTFEIATVESGVRILQPVRIAGERFTTYGTVRSERSGDGWRHRFHNDGSSNPTLGRPRGDYGPDALVAGSPEAEVLLAKLAEEKEQARIAEEERLAAEAAERQRKEAAAAAKRASIEAAVAKHGAAFATRELGDMVSPGTRHAFLVEGGAGGGDEVWGTDGYACGSSFKKAVVHAGLLEAGEAGIVEVAASSEKQRGGFVGSPRHGINSENSTYTNYVCTLRLLERIPRE